MLEYGDADPQPAPEWLAHDQQEEGAGGGASRAKLKRQALHEQQKDRAEKDVESEPAWGRSASSSSQARRR